MRHADVRLGARVGAPARVLRSPSRARERRAFRDARARSSGVDRITTALCEEATAGFRQRARDVAMAPTTCRRRSDAAVSDASRARRLGASMAARPASLRVRRDPGNHAAVARPPTAPPDALGVGSAGATHSTMETIVFTSSLRAAGAHAIGRWSPSHATAASREDARRHGALHAASLPSTCETPRRAASSPCGFSA